MGIQVNAKQARSSFRGLLDRVEQGEEIVITRHGKPVARLAPPKSGTPRELPTLGDFRASIQVEGDSLSKTVLKLRAQERG